MNVGKVRVAARGAGDEVEQARRYLASAQDATGGWGYQAGRAAFVEPTALCLLALGSAQPDALRAGQTWLRAGQLADGSWGVSRADQEGSWATAWAIWALSSVTPPGESVSLARGVTWWATWQPWVGAPGQERDPALWIDTSLTGWPWSTGGTSWVEPTSLGIIALAVAGRRDSPRVTEGIRYLRDRVCVSGGWNVGNPHMLSQDLPPAIAPTALALLALQDQGLPPSDAHVSAGRATLDSLLLQARTPLNLAWGLWAARRYQRRPDDPARRLREQQASDGSWRGSPYLTALAVLALTTEGLP
jgi:hypothetical protein